MNVNVSTVEAVVIVLVDEDILQLISVEVAIGTDVEVVGTPIRVEFEFDFAILVGDIVVLEFSIEVLLRDLECSTGWTIGSVSSSDVTILDYEVLSIGMLNDVFTIEIARIEHVRPIIIQWELLFQCTNVIVTVGVELTEFVTVFQILVILVVEDELLALPEGCSTVEFLVIVQVAIFVVRSG
ncbi:hypothetical protein OB920_01375 [Halobacteria archaeon HArc-gm2]|nr:hypothetical protein [Halobacteria archaeon HArc-gm2]